MNRALEEIHASKIATALATLSLAFRLSNYVAVNKLTSDIFYHDVFIDTGDSFLKIPSNTEGSQADLQSGISNLLLIALSTSALVLDEILEERFGRPSEDREPSRSGIRAMVHQLRNAFAHNPWRPKWKINDNWKKVFPVTLATGEMFNFDTRALNGKSIQPKDVGGLEFWLKVIQHCGRLVDA
jgi:hypothetical protein